MNYLITGGCGFLGSNITAALLRTGHPVTVFDNMARAGSERNLAWLRDQGSFTYVHGDIRSRDDCAAVVERAEPDVIFHLAGQVAMTTSLARPLLDFEVNAQGTLNLLEAVRTGRPGAGLIYSSTNKVYGDLTHLRCDELPTRYALADYPQGLPETLGLEFHSPYGCSKGCADQYVLDYARMYGLKTAVFRHSSMYGGRQFATFDQGWIGWFCQQALRQAAGDPEPFTLSGDGKQVRDVLHADDMVALYLGAAERLGAIAGQAFNVGGGMANSLSLLELLAMLEAEVGCRLHWRHLAPRESDQLVFVADIRKLQRVLGWSPVVGKAEGLTRMLDWLRSEA